jgi:hypothetical protein
MMHKRQKVLLTGVAAGIATILGSVQASAGAEPIRGQILATYVHPTPERTVLIVGGERRIRIFHGAAEVESIPFDACSAAQITADASLETLFIACRDVSAIAVVSVADASEGMPPDFITTPGSDPADIAMLDGRLFATFNGTADLFQMVTSARTPWASTSPDMSAVGKVWEAGGDGNQETTALIEPLADGRLIYRSDPWHAGGVLALDQWGQSLLPSEHFQSLRDLTVSADGYAAFTWTEPQGASLIDFVGVGSVALDAEALDPVLVPPIAELADYTGAVAADGGLYAMHKDGRIHFYDWGTLEGEPPYAPTREVAHFEPFGHVQMRALPAAGLLLVVGDRSIDFVPSGAVPNPADPPEVCPPPPPLPVGLQDDDGDGVVNQADRCPRTPQGTDVDAEGCSKAQFCALRGPKIARLPMSAISRYSWFARTCAALDYRNDEPWAAYPQDCHPRLTRLPPQTGNGKAGEPWFTATCQ